MAYDYMGKGYKRRMGSNKGGGSVARGFNSVRYSDRGERKGEQGTRGCYGRGMGPRIYGTPGPDRA